MQITIDVTIRGDGVDQLVQRLEHMQPFLAGYGEGMVERTKQRFATATDPSGQRWQPNSQVTLMRYLERRGAFSGKTGKISAKGQVMAMSKLPLQGQTRSLARQFFSEATDDTLVFGNSMIYAAMQNFGGKKAQFANLWGDVPARRFIPITTAGELEPAETALLTQQLTEYLGGE